MARKRTTNAYQHQQQRNAVQSPPSPPSTLPESEQHWEDVSTFTQHDLGDGDTLDLESESDDEREASMERQRQTGDVWEDVDTFVPERVRGGDGLELDGEGREMVRQADRRNGSGSAGSSTTTPRRRIVRRPKTKMVVPIQAASPRRQAFRRPASTTASAPVPSNPSTLMSHVPTDEIATGLRFTLRYFITVLGRAISLLKLPISLLLCAYLFALLVNRAAPSLHRAFAPACRLPFASSLALCAPPPPAQVRWADYPAFAKVQSASLDELLENAAGGPALALELKRAEMATGDLAALVRASDMPAREAVAGLLSEFVLEAREAGRGLHRLSAKIGGTVDTIMAVNDHALKTISDAHTLASAPRTLPQRALDLLPWARTPDAHTHALVSSTFNTAMSTLASQLARLVLEAELSIAHLTALEERLHTLHALASTEDAALTGAQEELLAQLWTRVGGNARERRRLGGHRALLGEVGTYRRRARVHVVAALQTLLALGGDVEEMRERVSAPELLGEKIPVEVHMRSIQAGLERLKESRVRAKRVEEDTVRRVLEIED